ncbi:MAG TPA: amidohydrolase family protein, partial [Candidatus Methylomirabilis sp.]|nr:amidohydrolase family protein [Candidatus Methylomirabilis sp.]
LFSSLGAANYGEIKSASLKTPELARLVSGGQMITVPGGYGSLFVTSPEDAAQKVDAELDQGADLIKLSLEDGYAGRSGLPKLSPEELAAVISAAHKRGKLVSAHVTQGNYMQMAVDAGVDDAAHMIYDGFPPGLIQRMVQEDIYIVPTLTVLEAYGVLEPTQRNLREFVAAGGKVALGNDYTRIPQNNFDHFDLGMPMHEIGRMAEAGITPMQIIVASTSHAAHVCDLEQELGTLEPGKIADVLVVGGDPLADLQALTDVRMVIHGGQVIRDVTRD